MENAFSTFQAQKVFYLTKLNRKKKININNIDGPLGVNGRNSDNSLIKKTIDWEPKMPLVQGLEITYGWIEGQVQEKKN